MVRARPYGALLLLTLIVWGSAATGADASHPDGAPNLEIISVTEVMQAGAPALEVTIVARDPDGIITEIDAFWDDGSIDFAHGYPCLIPPIPAPGTPHQMILTHAYAGPGTYTAEFEALSLTGCDAPPEEEYEVSATLELDVVWSPTGATTTTSGSTSTAPDETTTTTAVSNPPPAPPVSVPPSFTG